MKRTVKITVDEDTYFKLVRLKADLKAKTWSELAEKMEEVVKEKYKKYTSYY